jgi:hypothetical protein
MGLTFPDMVHRTSLDHEDPVVYELMSTGQTPASPDFTLPRLRAICILYGVGLYPRCCIPMLRVVLEPRLVEAPTALCISNNVPGAVMKDKLVASQFHGVTCLLSEWHTSARLTYLRATTQASGLARPASARSCSLIASCELLFRYSSFLHRAEHAGVHQKRPPAQTAITCHIALGLEIGACICYGQQ